jgi:Fur family transcriptional regulator, stress-responsive regulator
VIDDPEQQSLAHRQIELQSFEQQLRSSGLQVTVQRLAVMRAVSACPHATAEELTEVVRDKIGTISRQAVYDVLGALADKRLIRRIQPTGSPSRYEDRVGDNHHHLVCRVCGLIFDIDCAIESPPCLDVGNDQGFEIDEAEVVYRGKCPDCQR